MQVYSKNAFALLIILPLFLMATMPARPRQAASKKFTVIYGSGGGFTGMANGYIIYSDGKVEKWSGLYFRRSKIEKLGAAAPKTLQPLQKVFDTLAFKKWKYKDVGNMTTQMWCISGKDTTTISWKGTEPGKEVPPPIREFYLNLQSAVQSIKKP